MRRDRVPAAVPRRQQRHAGAVLSRLPWLHKWQSVTLLGAAEDAEHVATHIASTSSAFTPLAPPVPTGGTQSTTPGAVSSTTTDEAGLEPRCGSMRKMQAARSQASSDADLAASAGAAQSSDGAVGTMGEPQLYGADALTRPFDTWRQLIDGASTGRNPPRDLSDGSKQRAPLSYARLAALMDASPQMLADVGIGRTDRLCSALPNGPEAASAFLVLSLSCVYAPLNARSPKPSLPSSLTTFPPRPSSC